MQASPTKYLTCAETAKMIRAAVKAAFPGVKFSVRSDVYAGGASIDVGWTDGPTSKEVDKVVKPFEGASFDGMIDLKSYHSSLVTVPGQEMPEHVHFGADYVFTHRSLSPALMESLTEEALSYAEALSGSSAQVWRDTPSAWQAFVVPHRSSVIQGTLLTAINVAAGELRG